jgi:hypothetical protein
MSLYSEMHDDKELLCVTCGYTWMTWCNGWNEQCEDCRVKKDEGDSA